MEIRKMLLYRFVGIVALILLVFSVLVYITFSRGRKEDFYNRLEYKAAMAARLLIDVNEISPELLRRIERTNPVSLPNEIITVYNDSSNIIFTTDDDQALDISSKVLDLLTGEGKMRLKQDPYEVLGQVYMSNGKRYLVFAAGSDIFGFRKLKILGLTLATGFVFSLIFVCILGRTFVLRAITPVSDMMQQVEAISIENLNSRISEGNGRDEIAQLARTFNKLLDRIETGFTIQKNFIANASHELRTPLTIITGLMEVSLKRSRDNEEYRNTIALCLQNIKNLNKATENLLLLAMASSESTQRNFDIQRIDEVLSAVRSDIMRLHNEYRVNIFYSEEIDDESSLIVNGNGQMLGIALGNLIDNGCKYSPAHTSDIRFSKKENNLIIEFSDEGIGIPENEIEKVFHLFYRGGNATGTKGHGIGLSLAEKVITLHNGKLSVKSKIREGSTFTVSLPLHTPV
jgi:signal transduction histidine kinase